MEVLALTNLILDVGEIKYFSGTPTIFLRSNILMTKYFSKSSNGNVPKQILRCVSNNSNDFH